MLTGIGCPMALPFIQRGMPPPPFGRVPLGTTSAVATTSVSLAVPQTYPGDLILVAAHGVSAAALDASVDLNGKPFAAVHHHSAAGSATLTIAYWKAPALEAAGSIVATWAGAQLRVGLLVSKITGLAGVLRESLGLTMAMATTITMGHTAAYAAPISLHWGIVESTRDALVTDLLGTWEHGLAPGQRLIFNGVDIKEGFYFPPIPEAATVRLADVTPRFQLANINYFE
jgi:hypothetical protein